MAAITLNIEQTGSATTKLSVQVGDTIKLCFASTVYNPELAAAVASLQQLAAQTGVTFAIDTAGNAS